VKRIKSYKRFTNERYLTTNEDISNWIKSKVNIVVDKFKEVKGKARIALISSLLPKEVIELINIEANKYDTNESLILEEFFNTPFKSDEEIAKMSDEEYNNFLNDLSKDVEGNKYIAPKINLKGEFKGKNELSSFLKSNGIDIESEVIIKTKPSVENISNKIDELGLNSTIKSLLKGISYCVFFFMIFTKMGGTAYGNNLDNPYDGDFDDDSDDDSDDTNLDGDKVDDKNKTDKDKGKFTKVTNNIKTVENSINKDGWVLDSVKVDTIWKEVVVQLPDTIIYTADFKFDGDQFFASGKYDLDKDNITKIEEAFLEMKEEGTIITDILIESSTDKQGLSDELKSKLKSKGYEPNNNGLSKARCESISNHLLSNNINKELITLKPLSEQGTGEKDASARYVNIKVIYMKTEEVITPEFVEKIPELKTTYYLSKDKTGEVKKIKGGGSGVIKKHGPIENQTRSTVKQKCFF
jgi:hypothetical protein